MAVSAAAFDDNDGDFRHDDDDFGDVYNGLFGRGDGEHENLP